MPAYYDVLKISKQATEKDIRNAYYAFMREYHPDHKDGNTVIDERFYAVQEAYNVLSDPILRRAYDADPSFSNKYPPRAPHLRQPEIRQLFKTLNAHIDALKLKTLPWFCYNQASFIRTLEQIHIKSSFFLYGFLRGEDVVLIQIFLNHTLTMLDALQTATEMKDKFKVLLNYMAAIQDDEQTEALEELYGLQMDAIIDAHMAISAQEGLFYTESGLYEFDTQINRIATLPLNGAKKQTQQQLLKALHTFREQVKKQLAPDFDLKEDLLKLTTLLASLSYQEESRSQDKGLVSTYRSLQKSHSLPQAKSRSLKTFLVNTLLWILTFLPKTQQRVKRYFESTQSNNQAISPRTIAAVITHFLDSNQDETLSYEDVPIGWSTRHQEPILTIWSSRQRLQAKDPNHALIAFRENDNDILDLDQAVFCDMDDIERYFVPPSIAYYAIQGIREEVIEDNKEYLLQQQTFLSQELAVQKAETEQLAKELAEQKASLPQQIEEKVAEKTAGLTNALAEQKAEASKLTNALAEQKAEASKLTNALAEQKAEASELNTKLNNQQIEMDQMKIQLALLMSTFKPQQEQPKEQSSSNQEKSKETDSSASGDSHRFF